MHSTPAAHAHNAVFSEFSDDPEFAELLQDFAARIETIRSEIRDAVCSGDLEQLESKAHQLKGAAGGYGFPGLSGVAGRLESASHSRATELSEIVSELLEELDRVTAGFLA